MATSGQTGAGGVQSDHHHELLVDELEMNDENSIDLSRNGFTEFPDRNILNPDYNRHILSLQIHHNHIGYVPPVIKEFENLVILDISNNGISHISEELSQLCHLQTLVAKNNCMDNDSLPKAFNQLSHLKALNLGGNRFTEFPIQLVQMKNLLRLYLASNRIREIPGSIQAMKRLEILNLGDNLLESIPAQLGKLSQLTSLNLAGNRLKSLPKTLIHLRKLRSLSLHNNRLSTLPPEIVSVNLIELSLRNNPLVAHFVQDLTFNPPSLMELSGRVIKASHLKFNEDDLPPQLLEYLKSANKCVNPRCKGVFFTSKVEHVKFVDFCGKFRLPLLQYLCSPRCSEGQPLIEGSSDSESDDDLRSARKRMRLVLLG